MISVIIPSIEEPSLNDLVWKIHSVLKEEHEIIIIDASNATPKVKGARIYRQVGNGLGNAVLEGIGKSGGDVIIVMDADFSHDPEEIPVLLKSLERNDVVIGSRYCIGGKTEDIGRRFGIFPNSLISKIYCSLSSSLLGLNLKDPMNGFAAVRREVYDSLNLRPLGYKIHMETAFKAKKSGFSVEEVPTTFRKRRAGKSKTGVSEAIRTVIFMFALRFGLR